MRKLLIMAIAMLACGCASAPKSTFNVVSESGMRSLRESAVLAVAVVPGAGMAHYTSAEQGVMMSGMMFGAIGGAVGAIAATSSANRRGARFAEEMGIDDPSLLVAERLRMQLDPESLHSGETGPRVVLKTTHWQYNQSGLGYTVHLQAFTAGGGREVAKGECRYLRKAGEMEAPEQMLLAGSAAGLKREYARAAEHCADYFMAALLPAGAP